MVTAASLLWKRSLSGTLWVTPAPCNHVCVYRCLSAACQQTVTSAGWRAPKFPERSRSYFTSWWNRDHHIPICHTSPPGSSHFLRRIARQGFHRRVTVTPFRLTYFVLPQSILPPCTSVHHVYLAGQSRSSVYLEMELLEVVSHRCSPFPQFLCFIVARIAYIVQNYLFCVFNDPHFSCKHFGSKHYTLHGIFVVKYFCWNKNKIRISLYNCRKARVLWKWILCI